MISRLNHNNPPFARQAEALFHPLLNKKTMLSFPARIKDHLQLPRPWGAPLRHSAAAILLLLLALLVTATVHAQRNIVTHDKSSQVVHQINELFNQGRWEEGKQLTEQHLKDSKDSDLKMLLGKYYVHHEDYHKARFELNKALEYNNQNVDARQLLVTVETETGRYSSAICYVNELLEVNPYWKGLWRKKIELYRLQGNIQEADRLRSRINQIFPQDDQLQKDHIYNTQMEAIAHRQKGNVDAALQLSKSLIAQEPENSKHYLDAANDNLKAGDWYGALSFVERGLVRFPQNQELIDKKAGLLAEQHRYADLLIFLQQNQRQQQYDYYLQVAARHARNLEATTLYGKVFQDDPGNLEAFNQVFNQAMASQDYEQALVLLRRHRSARGNTKELMLKEALVYRLMGNTGRANRTVKELFIRYPDHDVTEAYVGVLLQEARGKMEEERYGEAISDWEQISRLGSPDLVKVARNAIYTCYFLSGDYSAALTSLDMLLVEESGNPDLLVKQAEVHLRLENFDQAFSSYQQAIQMAPAGQKKVYLGGFADMATQIISRLNEDYRHPAALEFVRRWLEVDPSNKTALRYGVNLSHLVGNKKDMQRYSEQGRYYHPEEVFFKVKIAELIAQQADAQVYEQVYDGLLTELQEHPYHRSLIDALTQTAQGYSQVLMEDHKAQLALVKLDTALVYAPASRELQYLKGVAYEKLQEYDSAYYYQGFYEPSALELRGFKQHLNYLQNRAYKNQISLSHLRSRHGDHYSIQTLSSLQYTRFAGRNTYTGRIHYTGREPGKGVQLQGEWLRQWNEKTSSMINAAWANEFFPSVVINASLYRETSWLGDTQLELGLGYRSLAEDPDRALDMGNNMFNLVVGATKELESFRLNSRVNVFLLQDQLLYNLSLNARHYLSSPRNFLMATGSIGSSPDVELIDYQLYSGFSVLNTMVGAGVGHLITKNVSGSLVGNWYHYQTPSITESYRNLYNLEFQLHVAF